MPENKVTSTKSKLQLKTKQTKAYDNKERKIAIEYMCHSVTPCMVTETRNKRSSPAVCRFHTLFLFFSSLNTRSSLLYQSVYSIYLLPLCCWVPLLSEVNIKHITEFCTVWHISSLWVRGGDFLTKQFLMTTIT